MCLFGGYLLPDAFAREQGRGHIFWSKHRPWPPQGIKPGGTEMEDEVGVSDH